MKRFRYGFRIRKDGTQYIFRAYDLMYPNDENKGYNFAFSTKRPSLDRLLQWIEIGLNETFAKMAKNGDVESFEPSIELKNLMEEFMVRKCKHSSCHRMSQGNTGYCALHNRKQ